MVVWSTPGYSVLSLWSRDHGPDGPATTRPFTTGQPDEGVEPWGAAEQRLSRPRSLAR
jgi:hypothetical protein